MSDQLTLSVVDQSPVRKGGSAADALRETVELAVLAESLGYRRYWVAEHHNLPGFAGTSPELLIGQIAARTQSIRVGSGGVMLSHYSALRVAEQFRILESFYPGRIDLGLGRAPGGDGRTATALAYPGRIRDISHYPEQIDDLAHYLGDTMPAGHPFEQVRAAPTPSSSAPELWLLGSGFDSALIAAERGLPFSFAHFFGTTAGHGPAVVAAYREHFQTNEAHREARVNVSAQVVCAASNDEAERLAASLSYARLRLALGQPEAIVSPEEALAYPYRPEERDFVENNARSSIVGDPDRVADGLLELAKTYECNDLGIVTICYDFEARCRSYELIAERFDLARASESTGWIP